MVPFDSLLERPLLFELPVERLTLFIAELHRLRSHFAAVCIHGSNAYIQVPHAPQYFALSARDDAAIRIYTKHDSTTWVELGYRIAESNSFIASDNRLSLLRAAAEPILLSATDWHTERELYPLVPSTDSAQWRDAHFPQIIRQVLRLRRSSLATGAEQLWIFHGTRDRFQLRMQTEDQAFFAQFELAQLSTASDFRAIFRQLPGRAGSLVAPHAAYVRHATLPHLYIPVGYALHPQIPAHHLALALGLNAGHIAWLELQEADRFVLHTMPTNLFAPYETQMQPICPSVAVLKPIMLSAELFDALPFQLEVEQKLKPERAVPKTRHKQTNHPKDGGFRSWVSRLKGHIFGESQTSQKPSRDPFATEQPEPIAKIPRTSIAEQRLSRTATDIPREKLEHTILHELHLKSDAEAAQLWQQLAQVYEQREGPRDAFICWVNAVAAAPASALPEWYEQLLKCASALPFSDPHSSNPAGTSHKINLCRVGMCAVLNEVCGTGVHKFIGDDRQLLREVLALESQLPVQLLWLFQKALAERAGGDPLALARLRDRIVDRLNATGLALDIDAPACVRFHGIVGRDRFTEARNWLQRIREPMQKWLLKHGGERHLQRAGLEARISTTIAFTDCMIAWGSSKLGDRQTAQDLMKHAEQTLDAEAMSDDERAVQLRILGLFQERIRWANEGRTSLAMPEPVPQALDELGNYTIAKLRSASRILDPTGASNPYGDAHFTWVLGLDDLADRLTRWLKNPQPVAVRGFLADVAAEPTARILPRVVLALASRGDQLDAEAALYVLTLIPSAMELFPEMLRTVPGLNTDERAPLIRLTVQLLRDASRLAMQFRLREPLKTLANAMTSAAEPDSVACVALLRSGSEFFRALCDLDLKPALSLLMKTLERSRTRMADSATDSLTLASGWLLLGNEERGMRLLNDARDRLFLANSTNERERTNLALAYVRALGHTPHRLAAGRLEELFHRLGRVYLAGATSRNFALKPLELIDAAVSTIVSGEFNLGTLARNWLDEQEQRIRKRIARDLNAALEAGQVG